MVDVRNGRKQGVRLQRHLESVWSNLSTRLDQRVVYNKLVYYTGITEPEGYRYFVNQYPLTAVVGGQARSAGLAGINMGPNRPPIVPSGSAEFVYKTGYSVEVERGIRSVREHDRIYLVQPYDGSLLETSTFTFVPSVAANLIPPTLDFVTRNLDNQGRADRKSVV